VKDNFKDYMDLLDEFSKTELTKTLASIEKKISGIDKRTSVNFLADNSATPEALVAAFAIKKASAQIDVLIHSMGILRTLPLILEKNEIVESVSLGAGNTGKKFDLETNIRVAEFKFIDWKGGSESIRQNGIFKDFYGLAEDVTIKKKQLFVLGDYYPLKFFNGRRAISSVLSRNRKIEKDFLGKYGERIKVVSEYYELYCNHVEIIDISSALALNE
jgi:hypothetical protein